MAVQFILGRSGTGKSSYCISAIVDALVGGGEQRLIFLVPEQASYQAERAILADNRIPGYHRLQVLSFDRLGFLLLGKDTARPALTRIGQQMIIHRLLRENSSRLKVFDLSASSTGLCREMAETISELHHYAKTPQDIDRLLAELGGPMDSLRRDKQDDLGPHFARHSKMGTLTALKFGDIKLIFEGYLKAIEGRFSDPDIQLNQACQAVAGAEFVKGSRLWIDGFSDFNNSQLAIIAELLKAVEDAQIALCLDPSSLDLAEPDSSKSDLGPKDPAGLFSPTEQTYRELLQIIKRCRLKIREPVILKEAVRFSGCRQLAHIERNISRLEPAKIPAEDNVRIVTAANVRAEVQFVAREILRLVREKDYRYRDIAVITSDIELYHHYIRAYFDDYGIPFFVDRRKPFNQHPVVELICSALKVVIGGFSGGDIFSYLKTDLVPVRREEVDLLENYCLACGIGPGEWQSSKEWCFAGGGEPRFDERLINQIRLKASEALLNLREEFFGDNAENILDAGEFTRIIFDFLESLWIRKKIETWIEQANEAGDYTIADEHRQFYEKLVNIFDELVEVFAGHKMSCTDYLAVLSAAFSQLTLSFIPASLDQILVGSIERSRHPNLKGVFLLGATQRQFPTPVGRAGILTDEDRIAAGSADFGLAATGAERLIERQYLAYIAFTRPSEFLCVSYPVTDEKGSPQVRSQFVDNLEAMFENLSEHSVAERQRFIQRIYSKSELCDFLCRRLGGDRPSEVSGVPDEQLEALLNDVCSDEQLAEIGSSVAAAIDYDNVARLDEKVVKELVGRELKSSATKLSTFAACPYQYFARYILGLEKRAEFKLEPLDVGVFYHRVLDRLLKRVNAEKKDFATASDEELLKLLRGEIKELLETDSFICNFRSRSLHNAFIINSACEELEDCVPAIAQMVRAGDFRPVCSEVWFGDTVDRAESLGQYKISLSNGRILSLDGKIDRLDIAESEGKKIAVVFDYKRKGETFSWPEFYYGLDMQLAIYMLAVSNASNQEYKPMEAVGAFYMPVEIRPVKAELDELAKKTNSFNYKAKGIFNGEYFLQLDSKINSGWSQFYSFFVKKDGGFGHYATSSALKPEHFKILLGFTEQKIVELTEQILSGKIDISPYRLGTDSACSRYGGCKYKSLCRFDWQVNDLNPLVSLGKEEVLRKIGEADG